LAAFDDLVRRLVESFTTNNIDYMFTGALAASFYGVPRTTADVDVVVAVSREGLRKLVSALKQAGLVVDEREVNRVLESGYRIADFKDSKTPYSVDIIFSAKKKLEKRAGTVVGLETFYQTPEELILAKLRMIKAIIPKERSVKDGQDVIAILNFTKVNVEAVKKQAKKDNTFTIYRNLTKAKR